MMHRMAEMQHALDAANAEAVAQANRAVQAEAHAAHATQAAQAAQATPQPTPEALLEALSRLLMNAPMRQAHVDLGAANSSGNSSLKAPPPARFKGEARGGEVETWLFSMERHFKALNVTDQQKMINFAATLFDKEPVQWWRLQCLRRDPPFDTWADFCAAMRKQYLSVLHLQRARDRLASLTQTSSVRKYTQSFSAVCLEIGDDLSESEKFDRFKRGLKPRMRQELELRRITDYEEAITVCERMDDVLYAYRDKNNDRTGFASWSTPAPTPMELGNQELAALLKPAVIPGRYLTSKNSNGGPPAATGPRLSDEERRALREQNACFYCRQPGHTMKECKLKPPRPKNFLKGPPPQRR